MAAQPPRSRAPGSLSQPIVSGLILTLVLMRYFDVVESAAQGDTLWIVLLWLSTAVVWLVSSWRTAGPALSYGWLDLGVTLLCGGHLLAALTVIFGSGEKRAAMNLAWEWAGVLVSWFLIRSQCRCFGFRRELVIALIAIGVSTAGLGLYQHYIGFPGMAAKYAPLFDDLKSADPQTVALARQKLAKDNVPLDDVGGTLFEKRLRDSQEPLGLFALANSFGGFLATCLVCVAGLAAAEFSAARGQRHWRRVWVWIIIAMLLGWCLLLTKSRTAFIGTFAGLAVWALGTRKSRWTSLHWFLCGIGVALLLAIGWAMVQFGSLDRQVITEAPKSLKYRLQYWAATWQIIRQKPWFGVGPGQFRSNYLIHRLPDASEEISDPHNLVLDVAANGGILAVIGLAALCLWLFFFPEASEAAGEQSAIPLASRTRRIAMVGLAGAAWCGLLTGYDDRLLVLIPCSVVLFWLLDVKLVAFNDPEVLRRASRAAAVALLVHLCGAGGIGMPGICILWLVLFALAEGSPKSFAGTFKANPGVTRLALTAVCLIAIVGLFWTALMPVHLAQIHLNKGDQLAQTPSRLTEAAAEYRLAAASDRLSAEPWRKQANLTFYQVEQDQFRSNDLFQSAVRLMHESRQRDPLNYRDPQTLGECWLNRWRVTKDPNDARESMQAMEQAWQLCPTNSLTMAQLTFAREAAGAQEAAREMATKALKQDDLNHKNQHVDRYLKESLRTALERLGGK